MRSDGIGPTNEEQVTVWRMEIHTYTVLKGTSHCCNPIGDMLD